MTTQQPDAAELARVLAGLLDAFDAITDNEYVGFPGSWRERAAITVRRFNERADLARIG